MTTARRRQARQARQGGRRPSPLLLSLCLVCVTFSGGCALCRQNVDRDLLNGHASEERAREVAARYRIGCPDVLDVTVTGATPIATRCVVDPAGAIDLGTAGAVRVEGLPVAAAAARIAAVLGVPPDSVTVHVQDYQSQQVYLVGAGTGTQRAVPYEGPETVLDLLERVGGLAPGAADGDVYVVRSEVAAGRAPEVFHIDLRAIVLDKDPRTNIRLQPFDQVHVGETNKSWYRKCVPPCLRPLYEKLCGLGPPKAE
jgi:protein involved in polysaccharide export with SLBB domain